MNYDMYLYEKNILSQGYKKIAGVDEVGRGPLAGPVVVCACILKLDHQFTLVNDSKLLTYKQRELALKEIMDNVVCYKIIEKDSKVIDKINILNATKEAMRESVLGLEIQADYILIDYVKINIDIPSLSLVSGDKKSVSIAAASIIAKQYRDNLMREYHKVYEKYDFINNMGYPTKKHLDALLEFGITPIHRLSYGPVKKVQESKIKQDSLFD